MARAGVGGVRSRGVSTGVCSSGPTCRGPRVRGPQKPAGDHAPARFAREALHPLVRNLGHRRSLACLRPGGRTRSRPRPCGGVRDGSARRRSRDMNAERAPSSGGLRDESRADASQPLRQPTSSGGLRARGGRGPCSQPAWIPGRFGEADLFNPPKSGTALWGQGFPASGRSWITRLQQRRPHKAPGEPSQEGAVPSPDLGTRTVV